MTNLFLIYFLHNLFWTRDKGNRFLITDCSHFISYNQLCCKITLNFRINICLTAVENTRQYFVLSKFNVWRHVSNSSWEEPGISCTSLKWWIFQLENPGLQTHASMCFNVCYKQFFCKFSHSYNNLLNILYDIPATLS